MDKPSKQEKHAPQIGRAADKRKPIQRKSCKGKCNCAPRKTGR